MLVWVVQENHYQTAIIGVGAGQNIGTQQHFY